MTLPSSAFVFSNSPDGSAALLPSTVSQRYRRLAVRSGLRSTRLHGCDTADRSAGDTIASLLPIPDPTLRSAGHPYEVVAADLREQIRAGTLAPGSQLPTSIELAEQHDVSVGTVNRAVALLKKSSLIEATRGRRAHVKVIEK